MDPINEIDEAVAKAYQEIFDARAPMKTSNTHGGARRHAGRPAKPGWKLVGVRLELETSKLLKRVAQTRETSQSELANDILKHYLSTGNR
jgi:hypothetical protein